MATLAASTTAHSDDSAAQARLLRVATSGDYAPFSFELAPGEPGSAEPTLQGFDIDVANAFARDRGYRLELHRVRWTELSKELAARSFDVAMSGVTVKPERAISGRYSVPVAASHAVALTWKGSGASTLGELDRSPRHIAVNAGGHLEGVARRSFHRAEIYAIPDNDAVRMALLDRAFDAVVTDDIESRIWTSGLRDTVSMGPLSDDRKAYLLPADAAVLEAELDSWLLARENDGTLAALRRKWFLDPDPAKASQQPQPMATATPLAALASAVLERQSLMPMVYEAKKQAGKPIEDKAQETAVLEAALRAIHDAATAAGVPAPDDESSTMLVTALMEAGKDAQRELAERAERRRPGLVQHRPGTGSGATSAALQSDDDEAADDGVEAAPEDQAGDAGAAAMNAAPAPATASPGGDARSATAAPAGAAARPLLAPPIRSPGPPKRIYDLASELRPALSRITDKIARIVVAMQEPIAASDARRVLAETLLPAGVRVERVDALSEAVLRISRHR